MRYFEHITLTTGHRRRSMAGEVPADIIASCQASLAIALARDGTHAALAADVLPGHTITATAAGRCLVATVWHGEATPICTIGVAGNWRCSPRLWEILHNSTADTLATTPRDRPQAPWCAARLEAGIIHHLDALQWMGDFERCLAWAWLNLPESLT